MAQRNVEIVETKLDVPTILVEHEGKMLPIHSKYNPVAEAERFIDSLTEEIENSDHLLFYGVGLGYHIKVAQERYPEKVFSVYEPIVEVSNAFIQQAKKTGVKIDDLAKNYLEPVTENIVPNIHDFSVYFAHRVLIVTLPIYEKLVAEEMQLFNEFYKKIMQEKVGNKQIDKKFGERWIINTIMNAKHTFTTPNLLMQESNPFEGKPVILAAAGPSLSDEIDNLKYIKEHGLAYIFAVGSANKALINYGVMPDAVLSYDPQGSNWQVFEGIMERNIDTIPLIFGTTVGYETVDYYPGPKAHVVMSKDVLTPYLHDAEMITINDSATISNVTFQILEKLKVSKVILVGQNFAYRDNQFYAKGIKRYDKEKQEESDESVQSIEQKLSFFVEDVDGNEVRTNITFDTMRKEMEYYLLNSKDLAAVNTTCGGAKINGAPFKTLSEIIDEELINSVVNKTWYEQLQLPRTKPQQKKLKKIHQGNLKFIGLFEELVEELNDLKRQAQSSNVSKIDKILERCSKLLDKMHNNQTYVLFIKSLVDLFTEQIYAEVSLCNKILDVNEKANGIANIYLNYLSNVLNAYEEINTALQMNVLLPLLDAETMKFYSSTSGVFHYEGKWSKFCLNELEIIENDTHEKNAKKKEIHPPMFGSTLVKSNNNGDRIEFRFKGTAIQFFGTIQSEMPIKIRVKIDGEVKNLVFRAPSITKCDSYIYSNDFFEVKNLSNRLHDVSIEILSADSEFIFTGIKINKEGRTYHIQEVTKIEDLTVDKRIRCHYEAIYNTVGEFSGLGEEINVHLPVEAKKYPNGDFYFIMVDEFDGERKLIADRNIQNYISWKTITEQLSSKKLLSNAVLDLPTGGHWNYRKDKSNDWDRYINNDWFGWFVDFAPLSWTKELLISTLNNQNLDVTVRGDIIFNANEKKYIKCNDFIVGTYSNINKFTGFRPKLIIRGVSAT